MLVLGLSPLHQHDEEIQHAKKNSTMIKKLRLSYPSHNCSSPIINIIIQIHNQNLFLYDFAAMLMSPSHMNAYLLTYLLTYLLLSHKEDTVSL
jgi:hypothetical protein